MENNFGLKMLWYAPIALIPRQRLLGSQISSLEALPIARVRFPWARNLRLLRTFRSNTTAMNTARRRSGARRIARIYRKIHVSAEHEKAQPDVLI